MTADDLLALSDKVAAEALALREQIEGGTREQWSAWQSLNDAARQIHSAAAWLRRGES